MTEFSPLRDYFVTARVEDISASGSKGYVAVPSAGKVIAVRSVIHNAITAANAVLSARINGTNITGGTLTITQSGSAAADVDEAIPTALNDVKKGDALEILTNAGSTTACVCDVVFQIRK